MNKFMKFSLLTVALMISSAAVAMESVANAGREAGNIDMKNARLVFNPRDLAPDLDGDESDVEEQGSLQESAVLNDENENSSQIEETNPPLNKDDQPKDEVKVDAKGIKGWIKDTTGSVVSTVKAHPKTAIVVGAVAVIAATGIVFCPAIKNCVYRIMGWKKPVKHTRNAAL